MDKLFCDLPFVVTYLDDVLVHSSTIGKHKKHLKLVFDRIDVAGLTLHVVSATLVHINSNTLAMYSPLMVWNLTL